MLTSILLHAAGASESFTQFLMENLQIFLSYTGFANATPGHIVMLLVGLLFIFLAIRFEFEPMLLIPIGFGILIGNIPFKDAGLQLGIYEEGFRVEHPLSRGETRVVSTFDLPRDRCYDRLFSLDF